MNTILFATQFGPFITLRRPLGRIIQAQRLLSPDFGHARIQDVRKVPHRATEKPPVYFIYQLDQEIRITANRHKMQS